MTVKERVPLAPYTSLGVGGPARYVVEAASVDDIRAASALAREHALPLKILGGGTNVLVPDAGLEAVVVRLAAARLALAGDTLVAEAGASWDAAVARTVEEGLWGLENLSGIPGTVGGAVAGNIGAYGAAVSDTVAWVETLDLATGVLERLLPEACAFGYRTSAFKRGPACVVLRAAFALTRTSSPNLAYRDLAARFAASAPALGEVRAAVLAIRAEKFPDLAREGSAGSFWKNVIVGAADAERFAAQYPGMPLFPMPETDGVKVPVAWLLDHVLHVNGYARGPVRLFEKQPLVVVAARGARATEIDALAREIEARVRDAFGITLEREVETFDA